MNRTNLILLGLFAALLVAWLVGKDWSAGKTTGPAPRMFPDFNKEAVDRIEISGGWMGSEIVLQRTGSEWRVVSAGGFPAKANAVERFIDAVYNLRRENAVGTSEQLWKETETDEKRGRLVRVLKGEKPMAEFRVGKNPKGFRSYQEFFIRREGDATVYRTRTVLTKDRLQGGDVFGGVIQGFGWDDYVNWLDKQWVETRIWDLSGAEPVELWLSRKDGLDIKLRKIGDDKWELVEGDKPPVPADADAAESILSQLRYLHHQGVVGKYEEVHGEYGFDAPEATLVMTLKKKKKEEKKEKEKEQKEDGGKKEGGKKKPPEEKYVTLKRTVEVGKKIERPRDIDREKDKIETEKLYCIRVGGEFDDPDEKERSDYVFLVDTYNVEPLLKKLEEFKQKPEEEPKPAEEGEGGGEEKKPGAGSRGEEKKPAAEAGGEKQKPAAEAGGEKQKPAAEAGGEKQKPPAGEKTGKPAAEKPPAEEKTAPPAGKEKPPAKEEAAPPAKTGKPS